MVKIGKVETETLQRMILDQIKFKHPDVLVGSAVGEDCAAVSFGESNLIITTDPITGTTAEIGGLSIDIVCNDIASNGTRPIAVLLTLLVPEETTEDELAKVMADASARAAELGVEIIGGHTEVTSAVNRIVMSATAIGKQPKDQLVHNQKSVPGDVIMMTKRAGLEGTGIIAYEMTERLSSFLTSEEIRTAKTYLKQTSVIEEGIIAGKYLPHAMHDVTEGGVLGAVYELCQAADLGCVIHEKDILLHEITRKLCAYFQIDPLKLISSGALLIILPKDDAEVLRAELAQAGIEAAILGHITKEKTKTIITAHGVKEIYPPQSDALYDVLSLKDGE